MGSESSKSNKNDENIVAQEALKFGPPIGTSRNSQYSLTRDQLTHSSTQVKPKAPPPPYTKTDPLQTNQNARTSQNIQQSTATASKTGSQMSDVRNSDLKNKQTKASEIGNAANIHKPANQQQSDHLKQQNTNQNKVSSQVQLPSYDPTSNRFVWTNESSKSTIDFDVESQKVKKDVLSENVTATSINKELNKNKSLAEVRKLLVNDEYLSDVRFILNSIVFYGHKLFLVTASPLFYQHFQINGAKEMKVEGIEEGIFLAMLSFCYTGILHKLTDDNILSTLLAADKLKISQAYTTCCGFITTKINPDGVFVVFDKAIDLKNEQFQKKCLDYIKKNEAKCFSSKGFFKIGLASLVTMLEKCDYPTEKLNEIVEKWNHGPVVQETKSTNNPTGTQKKDGKKKENAQNQQQQVQKGQQQQPQKQQKPKNQQQQRAQQNPQHQRNQPNMQHFQQPNMPLFPNPFLNPNMLHFPQQMQQFQHHNMHHVQHPNMHHVQQQRNQQQHPSKNPKQNDGQKGKNRQQQNKKHGPGNQQIPNLIDIDIPPPPFAEGFQGNLPLFVGGSSMRNADSISNLSDDLMSFGGDDDDRVDDLNALVCVDDDEGSKIKSCHQRDRKCQYDRIC
ncbi:putative uncharacterized protein DDB_G0294196 isoform X2 [Chironomus tepperi]|uniref:putative uncharacterized protein DDB_G0294196 isoform X2 n=1 Tax=Chironomus tepperi TaxID=113505 RepID=UPI00391FB980